MLHKNPEFRKALSMEVSPAALIAIPTVIFLVVTAASLSMAPPRSISSMARWMLALAMFMGSSKAAQAITSEVRDGTWDLQRMTGMTPWTVLIGKLFGSTIITWYSIALVLPVVVHYSLGQIGTSGACLVVEIVVLQTLLMQLLPLLLSALNYQRGSTQTPRKLPSIIWIIIFSSMLAPMLGSIGLSFGSIHVLWWGGVYPLSTIIPISMAVFCGWALLGAHRAVSRSMLVSTAPGAWVAFIVFVALYTMGFRTLNSQGVPEWVGCLCSFLVLIALFYASLLCEEFDALQWRRLSQSKRDKQSWFIQILSKTPLWIWPLGISVVPLVGVFIIDTWWPASKTPNAFPYMLALLFLATRDGLIYSFVTAHFRSGQRVLALLFFALYAALPWLLTALHLTSIAAAFWPFILAGKAPALVPLPPLVGLACTVAAITSVRRHRRALNHAVT